MNWIGALASKKTDKEPRGEDLWGVVSERGGAMDALEVWLEGEFWNFTLGRNRFDGHSEGLCLLAGIDPEQSMITSDQYGPVFLPMPRDSYGISFITQENQWIVKDAIDHRVDDLKSLGLKDRVHCHDAIRASVEKKLAPFWLEAALSDPGCSQYLPEEMRKGSSATVNLVGKSNSKKRKDAWENDVRTRMLNEFGKPIFEEKRILLEQGEISQVSLANTIHDQLTARDEKIEHYAPRTIQGHIKKWLLAKGETELGSTQPTE
jgi:hypothetical protein